MCFIYVMSCECAVLRCSSGKLYSTGQDGGVKKKRI